MNKISCQKKQSSLLALLFLSSFFLSPRWVAARIHVGSLQNVQIAENCNKPIDIENGDKNYDMPHSLYADKFPKSLDTLCENDVISKYIADDKVHVEDVQRGELKCELLQLFPNMADFRATFKGTDYHATMENYEFFPNFENRHVWVGALVDQMGFINVVWDDLCNPDIFRLNINLEDDANNRRHRVTSMPCSSIASETLPGCVWMADIFTDIREEFDGEDSSGGRKLWEKRAIENVNHPDVISLDSDIRLLQKLHNGDEDANDHFTQNGGRRLHEEKMVLMPSGRKLDDGSVVRVLWLYTNRARDRWTDTGIKSKIIAGAVTANQVLDNSKAGFKIEVADVMYVEYIDSTHAQTLSDLNEEKIPGVVEAREHHKADLIQMIIESDQYCGYGNLLSSKSSLFSDYGYSVVYSDCISTYSHIHEIGHNMGCQHNYENSGHNTVWKYGDGYRYCNDGATLPPYYRSVMSYSCNGSTRIPYFSNPNAMYLNKPTGIAEADNVRVLQETRFFVANFRQGSTVAVQPTELPITESPILPMPITIDMGAYDYIPGSKSREGFDYHDVDTINRGSMNYRKDQGVDCSPGLLSYTSPSEWVHYTRNFTGGTADVHVLGSSWKTGGIIEVTFRKCNGTVLSGTGATTLFFPKTGSYSNYREFKLSENVVLPTGLATMRVTFISGGLNLKTVRFVPVSIADQEIIEAAAGVMLPCQDFFAQDAIIDMSTDINGIFLNADGRTSWIDSGDSIVFTLNVSSSGYYEVAYELQGMTPLEDMHFKTFLVEGRANCSEVSNEMKYEGLLSMSNIDAEEGSDFELFQATSIFLNEGKFQKYTLCFEEAGWVVLGHICIAHSCS